MPIDTLEHDGAHADLAKREFVLHGVAEPVEVRQGTALDMLAYYELTAGLVAPGGLLVARRLPGS